jgi:hypothetical protein
VAGAQTGAIVAMKLFIEQNQIAPVRVVLKGAQAAAYPALAITVAHKHLDLSAGQFGCDFIAVRNPCNAVLAPAVGLTAGEIVGK